MAFAALGAAEVLSVHPDDMSARALLSDAADAMTRITPACRVAMARAAPHLRQRHAPRGDDRRRLCARASGPRAAAGWTSWNGCSTARPDDGHLSVTPVGGSGPDDHGPGFDQQPIEVAALADACARAQDC